MHDKLQRHLAAEPKPTLSPFFASRLSAHARRPASSPRLLVLRLYWLATLLAILAILWKADLPPNTKQAAIFSLLPLAPFILLAKYRSLRRWFH